MAAEKERPLHPDEEVSPSRKIGIVELFHKAQATETTIEVPRTLALGST
jgi:hypothetical protein